MIIKIFVPTADIGFIECSNYTIDCWLKDHKIKFESLPFSRSHEADWVVISIHRQGQYGPNTLVDLFNSMPIGIREPLNQKLKSGRAGLLFWYPGELNDFEGHCDFPYKTPARLKLEGNSFPPTQVTIKNLTQADQYPIKVLVNNNSRRLTTHQIAKRDNTSTYKLLQNNDVTAEPLRFYEWQFINFTLDDSAYELNFTEQKEQLKKSDQIVKLDNFNWDKPKSFMCLNGSDKLHRRMMINSIRERNLEQHGFISYVCRYSEYDEEMALVHDIKSLSEEFKAVGYPLPFFQDKDMPIILDGDKDHLMQYERLIDSDLYNNAWINVVTESWPWKGTKGEWAGINSPIEITEKTFKPMVQLQPFLIFGSNNSLSKLHEWGYHTFDKIFDESYDSIQSVDDRLDAIVDQLAIWTAKSQVEKRTMIESVWDSLLHNRKILMQTQQSSTHEDDFYQLLKAIPFNNLQEALKLQVF